MKYLTFFVGVPFVYFFFVLTSPNLASCKKNTTTTTHVPDTALTNGLVAYYNFNGGNTNDSSGFNNNITFNNATPTTDRFGRANNAFLFDGSTSYMQVPNSTTLNPNAITLFAIVKVIGFNSGNCHENQILGKLSSDTEDGIYCLRFNDFTANCGTAPNTTVEEFFGFFGDDVPQGTNASAGSVTGAIVKTGQWYYLAFTFDGVNAKLYVNSVLVNSVQKTVAFTENADDLYIGDTPNSSFPYNFNGAIDEIRIYNRALPQSTISDLNNLQE